ncbi:MBL fold metallo-hydrolase [Gordonia polyisoprenivorans]|nr:MULTISPECIES: MBL fold metallo-hydrolase [Gordonia]MDF3281519.1 MBL fold metallo-hydrolase [Gordonia sp. N1V]NKY01031.1 MBL fold metallo-hydrolase [Gordonia polyisoprenivorans]OZC33251.1 MBL fold metallo-hydrolase [Gordonia polyisoprenivorans]UZF58946.1 MBL fold metallo-hydrolase [Gordonia polyisoprenivorans]WCB39990.1 MBL fold metallo-hydrolase [Gordonia polyisoprenivorans]
MMPLQIENVVTSGTFSLDGGTWDVDNNIWIVGDDSEVVIIDAAHKAAPILDAVGGRTVKAILLTHGHNDHITVAPELSKETGAPILLHPGDDMLWNDTHPDVGHGDLADGQEIEVAGTALTIINTPGHSPGSSVIYAPEAGVLFSGDTLFQGGPGATGRSFSSFPTIIESIRTKIFTLDPETKVYTGHGDGTTVAAEAPHLEEWIKRGS